MKEQLDPGHIMQTATAFWPSKVLLTAVELDLFTTLGDGKMSAPQLGQTLGLHPRGTYDFFDALVALKFLDRDGDGPEGQYKNTPQTAVFLNKKSPAYIGGLAEMLNARLFGFWNNLGTALKTGQPQNEVKGGGKSVFEELYSDPAGLSQFLDAMTGFQAANFSLLAEKFDFSKYKTVSDIGGALALLSRIVGARHQHLMFNSVDLPPVVPLAQKQIKAAGMEHRIKATAGDFFKEELPKADVVTMG
ncbi:MAG: methyltransferase family protein, partial [Nevskiales bacterium]